MRVSTWARVFVVVAVAALSLTGCATATASATSSLAQPGASAVARALAAKAQAGVRNTARTAQRRQNGTLRLRPRIVIREAEVESYSQRVRDTIIDRLRGHVADLNESEFRYLVKSACLRKDLQDIAVQERFDERVRSVVESGGGLAALPLRIASLADDLAADQSSGDQVLTGSVFFLCEIAG